ncbi:Co2+/Mg2+ efflux protein ApaG [Thiopseudomonas alkaliphila]|uniref:Co2+/Mg2+ efflux protein ApaG n=1 Tax=Thiopseudomonas alkaliphila TaxID=1697053 RepID=UPI00069D4C18|nr:Co2+/Mg2+ efflux protein ApaG [Thiopseudomonas alkaliphila]AKX51925.1 magnesium transporter ApaG [Thiopseudomonas alkaliphila]AKX58298.1 magnesium transporter ApaG [Thiopseudomonas alkaliphila]
MSYNIEVNVKTRYLQEHSQPEEERYVFAYDITIRNHGTLPAQLLSRHWIITDANGKVQEVRGEGVVGEQPIILPNESYQYSSGTIMPTEVGSMQGSFSMVAEDGHLFEAVIDPFGMAVPGVLH